MEDIEKTRQFLEKWGYEITQDGTHDEGQKTEWHNIYAQTQREGPWGEVSITFRGDQVEFLGLFNPPPEAGGMRIDLELPRSKYEHLLQISWLIAHYSYTKEEQET